MVSVLMLVLCTTATAKKDSCDGKSQSACTGVCAWFPITQSCIPVDSQPLLQHCAQIKHWPITPGCSVDCDKLGKVEKVPGTVTKVAVCGLDKKCTCANGGVGATGTACPKDTAAKCVACTGKFFLHNGECKAWTDCDKLGKLQTKAASNTADVTCGADKKCTCANGTGATGTACPKDKDAKCAACKEGFSLDGLSCKPKGFQAPAFAWDPVSKMLKFAIIFVHVYLCLSVQFATLYV